MIQWLHNYLLQRDGKGELGAGLRHPNNLLTQVPPRPADGGAGDDMLPLRPRAPASFHSLHHISQQLRREGGPSALLFFLALSLAEIDGRCRCRCRTSVSSPIEASPRKAPDSISKISNDALQRHDWEVLLPQKGISRVLGGWNGHRRTEGDDFRFSLFSFFSFASSVSKICSGFLLFITAADFDYSLEK